MSFTLNDITTKTTQLIAQGDQSITSSLLDLIYPIGSIYMNVNDTSPSLFLGGVWERIQDKFLLCSGNSYASGSSGGSSTKTLKAENIPTHTHPIDSQGAHTHTRGTMEITGSTTPKNRGLWRDGTDATASGAFSFTTTTANSTVSTASGHKANELVFTASKSWTGETSSNGGHTHTIGSTGSGSAFDIMPPYLAVFVWKRIS